MDAAVGHSAEIDTQDAVAEVLAQCNASLAGCPKGAILFASVEYDHARALDAITTAWPGVALIGGSTDGELSARGGFTHDSLMLIAFGGEGLTVEARVAEHLSAGPEQAVDAVTHDLRSDRPAACLTVFAPSTNSNAVVRELERRLPAGTPILGGLTGDHRESSRMTEFAGTKVLDDALTILLIYGDIHVSWGVGSGWFPIGEPSRVTASDGHIVHELDGRPAIETYRAYWGELPSSLGEYPIAVFPDGPDGPWCLRAAMEADPDEGWIRFAGDVPEGAWIRLTEVLAEGILSGTEESLKAALHDYQGTSPDLAIAFTCAARKWVLGTDAELEVGVLTDVLEKDGATPALAGCYCFGEIAPLSTRAAGFHNETCVTVLLGA